MALGNELWLVLALVLPLLAIAVILLLRQRKVTLSKNLRWVVIIITFALFSIYWIWSLFIR